MSAPPVPHWPHAPQALSPAPPARLQRTPPHARLLTDEHIAVHSPYSSPALSITRFIVTARATPVASSPHPCSRWAELSLRPAACCWSIPQAPPARARPVSQATAHTPARSIVPSSP